MRHQHVSDLFCAIRPVSNAITSLLLYIQYIYCTTAPQFDCLRAYTLVLCTLIGIGNKCFMNSNITNTWIRQWRRICFIHCSSALYSFFCYSCNSFWWILILFTCDRSCDHIWFSVMASLQAPVLTATTNRGVIVCFAIATLKRRIG